MGSPLLAATAAVQDIFAEYFITPPDPGPRSPLGFFWLLFCAARAALLPPQADLVTSFALLLACTHFMLRNIPRQHLRHADQQQEAPDVLLAAVAASHSAAEHAATVRQLAGLLQLLLAQVLQPWIAAVPVAAQDAQQQQQQQQQQQAVAGAAAPAAPPRVWLSFPGLVDADGQAAAAAVEALQQHYQRLTADADVDALQFLAPAAPAPSLEAATAATHPGAGAPAGAGDAAAGSAPAAEAQTHAPPAAAAAAQATAAEAAAAAAPEAQAGAGATGMEVDAATIPEAASAAAAAAGEEEPESPCARQHTQAVNSTPLR